PGPRIASAFLNRQRPAYIVGCGLMPLKVALIIPALDGEATLRGMLEDLPQSALAQIIVVDNGSRDRTAEQARTAGAQVVLEPRRGYGRARLAGNAAPHPGGGGG